MTWWQPLLLWSQLRLCIAEGEETTTFLFKQNMFGKMMSCWLGVNTNLSLLTSGGTEEAQQAQNEI